MRPAETRSPGETPTSVVCAPRVADYTLLDKLYVSSVCTIYKARQDRLGRVVCLKLLPEFPPPCDVALERFNRAAYVGAQVVHNNLPVLYETGTADGYHYAALEFVSGASLQDILIDRGRLSERRTVWIGLQVARALAALHEKGVVHRNVKPKNILVESNGNVRLVGMGLAKCDAACFSKNLDAQTIGTPHYMAPEMIRGTYTDPRSDLYSLGVTLYVMASGSPPFAKGTPASVMAKHLYEDPRPLRKQYPELSDDFEALVEDLLVKNPEERLSSAREAVRRLERLVACHRYDDLCFANVPRSFADKRSPDRSLSGLLWPLALFFGTSLAVFALGLLILWALPLLEFARPAAPAPVMAQPVVPPAAPESAPQAEPIEAPDPLARIAAHRDAELQRLRELDPVFRRDPWRGVRELESFLRVHPEVSATVRAEAEARIKLYRQMALDQSATDRGMPRADNAGEALDF